MKKLVDWNAHLLPCMREYITDPETSLRVMQEMSTRFGISSFCMTADFDASVETVAMHLLRLARSKEQLKPYLTKDFTVRYYTSVLLLPELSLTPDLDQLLFSAEKVLPIKLPICSYEDWMDLEFNHLLYKNKFRLFFTSFETAVLLYPPEILEKLMRISHAVFQFNYRSLSDPNICKVIKKLIDQRSRVLLGTSLNSLDKVYFYEMDHYLKCARTGLSAEEYRILMNQSQWFDSF